MAKKGKEEMRRFGKKPLQKLIGGIILLLLLSFIGIHCFSQEFL